MSVSITSAAFGYGQALLDLGITEDEIPWAKRVLEAARAYSNAPRATPDLISDLLAAADDM